MVSWSSSKGAWAALGIALAIGILIAWTQRTTGPSRAELAQALSQPSGRIMAADIKSLWCEEHGDGFACRWQQREDGTWVQRSGRMQADQRGWRLAQAASDGRQ